jgi:hypothetical protein
MIRAVLAGAIFMLAISPTPATAKDTKVPRGWTEETTAEGRVLSRGTSKIVIGHWQSLGSRSLEAHLKDLEEAVPDGAQFLSSRGVKPERIDGAFAVTRKIKRNAKSAQSVLYGCPGQPGFARVLSMTVDSGDFGNMMSGGLFLEKVCKQEPKGGAGDVVIAKAAPGLETRQTTKSPAAVSPPSSTRVPRPSGRYDLAAENAKIPRANRPIRTTTVLEERWIGFPATLTHKAYMLMLFPNGNATHCANWDLISQAPTPESIQKKRCKVTRAAANADDPLNGFEPGATFDLKFGRISASGFDGINSSSSTLSGGDLVLSADGRIAIGKFSAFSTRVGGGTAGAGGGTRRQVKGRYYLNGHTITIETDDGELIHTFIGWASNAGSSAMDHVYFAGDHYWDKD